LSNDPTLEALEEWLKDMQETPEGKKKAEEKILVFGRKRLSFIELVEGVKNNTDVGKAFRKGLLKLQLDFLERGRVKWTPP